MLTNKQSDCQTNISENSRLTPPKLAEVISNTINNVSRYLTHTAAAKFGKISWKQM